MENGTLREEEGGAETAGGEGAGVREDNKIIVGALLYRYIYYICRVYNHNMMMMMIILL